MKLSVLQPNFATALSRVSKAVASRSTLPILANILLKAEDGKLTLSATNLEQAVSINIRAKVEKPGTVTLPAKTLVDWVSTLPADVVEMTLDAKRVNVALQCGKFKANIKGIDADEFPSIGSLPLISGEGVGMGVVCGQLRAAIQSVVFATATDEARIILTGVMLRAEGQTLTLAASDGFRVAERHVEIDKAFKKPYTAIIPARALAELARWLTGDEETVTLTAGDGRVWFTYGASVLMTQLLEGAYPAYQNIIPKGYTTRVVTDANSLRAILKATDVLAREAAHTTRLEVKPGSDVLPGTFAISATAAETGDGEGELSAAVEGAALVLGANSRFLQEALGVLETPQVALEFTGPNTPITLRPVGANGYVYVLMPMHLGK